MSALALTTGPKHPWRIVGALILAGIGATRSWPLETVFLAGALRLLWDL